MRASVAIITSIRTRIRALAGRIPKGVVTPDPSRRPSQGSGTGTLVFFLLFVSIFGVYLKLPDFFGESHVIGRTTAFWIEASLSKSSNLNVCPVDNRDKGIITGIRGRWRNLAFL